MTTKVEDFAIVKAIMKVLKLDDAGKISKFFSVQVKEAKRAITQLEANIKALIIQYDIDVDNINNQIEDAEQNVEQAYQNVKPEDVVNNQAIEEYSNKYWNAVKKAENKLKELKEESEYLKERHEEAVDEINEQIAKYQERIDKITK